MNIAQREADVEDDRYVWFANINYQFAEYNAEWEAYLGADHNRMANVAAAAAATRSNSPEVTYIVGTRAQFDPVENLTAGAEVALQLGDYYGGSGVTANPERDRQAWAMDIFATYTWREMSYQPWLGLEYVHLSGDEAGSGDFEGWNGFFRGPTYGLIREYLDVIYQSALNSDSIASAPNASANSQHIALSAGFKPMDDLAIDGTLYHFWLDEDVVVGPAGNSGQILGDSIGDEIDINVTYAYTEDVTFGLTLAWFLPGELYEDYQPGSGGGVLNGGTDDKATMVTSSVNVVF